MIYKQQIEHCPIDTKAACAALAGAFADLQQGRDWEAAAILESAFKRDDLEAIETLAADIRTRFSRACVVGAGGSSLSGQTLTMLRLNNTAPEMIYLDTIDPDMMAALLEHDVKDVFFIFISKSGTTLETLAQLYVITGAIEKRYGTEQIARQCVVITGEGEHPMQVFAKERQVQVIAHPSDIGGRFSILTVVGLLPAAIAGLDIRAIRQGAASVGTQLKDAKKPSDFAPAIGAALQYGYAQTGYNINVMLPYSQRLAGFSSWYRQCWAESLGKNGKGTTPIRAVGTTDQHSQLQLYRDGPKDKLFHLIFLARAGQGAMIPAFGDSQPEYMRQKTIGDVMAAQQQATLETLVESGCPVRLFVIEKLDETAIGAVLMHFMIEVMLMAQLQRVNAFDQPAVEDSKARAYKTLMAGRI